MPRPHNPTKRECVIPWNDEHEVFIMLKGKPRATYVRQVFHMHMAIEVKPFGNVFTMSIIQWIRSTDWLLLAAKRCDDWTELRRYLKADGYSSSPHGVHIDDARISYKRVTGEIRSL